MPKRKKKDLLAEEGVIVCPPPRPRASEKAILDFVRSRKPITRIEKVLDDMPDDAILCGAGVDNTVFHNGKVVDLDEEDDDEDGDAEEE